MGNILSQNGSSVPGSPTFTHSFLIPDFSGIVPSFSTARIMLAIDYTYIAVIMLVAASPRLTFSRTFTMRACWILSQAFPTSIVIMMCFLSFKSNYVVYYIYWLVYCELRDKANWAMVENFLIYVFIHSVVCKNFIEDFASVLQVLLLEWDWLHGRSLEHWFVCLFVFLLRNLRSIRRIACQDS